MLLLTLGFGGTTGYVMASGLDLQKHKPEWWLRAELRGDDAQAKGLAWYELMRRLESPTEDIGPRSVSFLVEETLADQADESRSWQFYDDGFFVEQMLVAGKLERHVAEQYLLNGTDEGIEVRAWIKAGDLLPMHVLTDPLWTRNQRTPAMCGFGVEYSRRAYSIPLRGQIIDARVAIDGRQWDVDVPDAWVCDIPRARADHELRVVHAIDTSDLQPGTHQVELIGTRTIDAAGLPGGPVEKPFRVVSSFVVREQGYEPPIDERVALRDRIVRTSVRINKLERTRDFATGKASLTLTLFYTRLPAHFDVTAWVRPAESDEPFAETAARFDIMANDGGWSAAQPLASEAVRLPEPWSDIDTFDVQLRSVPVDQCLHVDPANHWTGTMTFKSEQVVDAAAATASRG
ncbi:MAG: hypothetical protein AAF561_05650 [Planctomycetota bacterium]